MVQDIASKYLNELKDVLATIPLDRFEEMLYAMIRTYNNGNLIFIMGNGGSGATASHLAGDINKGVSSGLAKRFRVICLNDNIPTILAYANDNSYDDIFVEQLKNFLNSGDLVIGISGSGNSANVIKAFQYANGGGAMSIAMTGFDGGKLAKIAKIPIVIPVSDMQKVEDIHLILSHMIMQVLYKKLWAAPVFGTSCYESISHVLPLS